MQRESVNRFTVFGKAALAGLLIAWVLLAAFVSSDRHLHEKFHHDSGQASHQCAISLFERGETLGSEPVCEIVLRSRDSTPMETVCIHEPFASFRFVQNSTRGPPV